MSPDIPADADRPQALLNANQGLLPIGKGHAPGIETGFGATGAGIAGAAAGLAAGFMGAALLPAAGLFLAAFLVFLLAAFFRAADFLRAGLDFLPASFFFFFFAVFFFAAFLFLAMDCLHSRLKRHHARARSEPTHSSRHSCPAVYHRYYPRANRCTGAAAVPSAKRTALCLPNRDKALPDPA